MVLRKFKLCLHHIPSTVQHPQILNPNHDIFFLAASFFASIAHATRRRRDAYNELLMRLAGHIDIVVVCGRPTGNPPPQFI